MTVTFNGAHLARDPGAGNKKTKNEGCHGQGCRLLAAALLAVVAGCAGGDVVLDKPGAGYVPDVTARVTSVDWSRAETIAVTLSEFQFSPARLTFQMNVPYRLRLRNAGARDHTFVSAGFFKAIAAGKLVSAEGEVTGPYLASIAVPPGAEKELFFVPVRTGTFGVACTVFLHESFGMKGKITVR
jgi:uncharacterized cupredoxin-like copper-binding protein